MSACAGHTNYIRSLEHVQVQLSLSYSRRGDLEISLTSPMGTRSTLVAIRCGGSGGGGPGPVGLHRKGQVYCGVRCGLYPMEASPSASTWHHSQMLAVPHWPLHDGLRSPPSALPPLVCPRPFDISGQGYNNWIFMSTHFWDEDPRGLWTLGLENKGYYFNTGERWAQAGGSAASLGYPTAEGLPVVSLKRL